MSHEPLPSARQLVAAATGGPRGLAETALPGMAFLLLLGPMGPTVAAGVAGVVVLLLAGARVACRQSPKRVLTGTLGLAAAIASAALLSGARDYFLPGMVVDAAWAVGLLLSVVVGHPAAGVVYQRVLRGPRTWRRDHYRLFAGLTVLWSAAYGVRGAAQLTWYLLDEPGLLAVSKLVLGWPLTALVLAVSLAAVGRGLPEQAPA